MVTKNLSGTTLESVSYTYDTKNRRISETATGTTNLTEQYAYDGGSLLAVINPSVDQVTEQYFDGPNADGQTQALAEETLSGNGSTGVKWMLTDNVGSVKDVVDNGTGHAVLDQIKYDSFGNILTQTNSGNDTRMGYTGYVQDAATSLDYANARYYQASTGRFISQDPSGFGSGDTNLYRYVGNHPTYAIDPTGLYAVSGFGDLGSSSSSRNYYSSTSTIDSLTSGFSGVSFNYGLSFDQPTGGSTSQAPSQSPVTAASIGSFYDSALAQGPSFNETATDVGTPSQIVTGQALSKSRANTTPPPIYNLGLTLQGPIDLGSETGYDWFDDLVGMAKITDNEKVSGIMQSNDIGAEFDLNKPGAANNYGVFKNDYVLNGITGVSTDTVSGNVGLSLNPNFGLSATGGVTVTDSKLTGYNFGGGTIFNLLGAQVTAQGTYSYSSAGPVMGGTT